MRDAIGVSRLMRTLDRHAHILDFDRDGLGAKLLDIAAETMLKDFNRQTSPDGTPWPPLSPEYEAWKQTHAPSLVDMGYLYLVMGAVENFHGVRVITVDMAESTWGEDDKSRQEADWFQKGDPSNNRPPRPFVGLSQEARWHSDSFLIAHLRSHL